MSMTSYQLLNYNLAIILICQNFLIKKCHKMWSFDLRVNVSTKVSTDEVFSKENKNESSNSHKKILNNQRLEDKCLGGSHI